MSRHQYFVGIDLHKLLLQVCVLDAEGDVVHEQRYRIDSLAEGLAVVQELSRWKHARYAVEALGLNRWFVNACQDAGFDIVVVDAMKLGLKRLGKKTDRRDALEIARRLRLGDLDRHAKTYFAPDDEYGLRKLERVRHDLVHQRQNQVNRLRAMLNSYKLASPDGVLYTAPSVAKLRAVRFPCADLNVCFQEWVKQMVATQGSINRMTARIQKLAKAPRIRTLQEMVPAFGPQTALTVIAELGDVSRFRNARAAASYAGLVPRVSASADKSHHGRLTKRGNPELRWILSQCAVRLMSQNDVVKQWAEPLLRRMHKNKVRMALARRLLVGVYAVLARGEVFCLRRCLGMTN